MLLKNINIHAQPIDGETSFFLAGVSTQLSAKTKLNLYGAYNGTDNIKGILAIPVIRLNKHISLLPSYMYIAIKPSAGAAIHEHNFLGSVLFTIPAGKHFSFDDRNMWWHRFRDNELKDLSFYRNRFRFTYNKMIKERSYRVYAFDEVFYSITTGKWTRNRLGLGISYQFLKWLTTEVIYAWQTDNVLPNRNIFFFLFTVPLEQYGIFKTNEKSLKR